MTSITDRRLSARLSIHGLRIVCPLRSITPTNRELSQQQHCLAVQNIDGADRSCGYGLTESNQEGGSMRNIAHFPSVVPGLNL